MMRRSDIMGEFACNKRMFERVRLTLLIRSQYADPLSQHDLPRDPPMRRLLAPFRVPERVLLDIHLRT